MDLSPLQLSAAICAGVLAGVINTLAGSGSLITLPMLMFLGLPATVANGTNRIGAFFQSLVGILTYWRSGTVQWRGQIWQYVFPAVFGSLFGAWLASQLTDQSMRLVIGIVMVSMLGVILIKPKRWLKRDSSIAVGRPAAWVSLLFIAVGFYGGFIQAGVGILLLASLVVAAGFNLKEANFIKLLCVFGFNLCTIWIFLVNGQIHWELGLIMAVGQCLGAWLAARFATRYEHADVWIRRLLIVIVLLSIAKVFGLLG